MVDFYTNGFSITISGWSVWLIIMLIAYIFFEYLNWINTRLFFFRKLFIYFRVRKHIKGIIPYWWIIRNISILTMNKRKGNSNIEVYFKVIYMGNKNPLPFGSVSDVLGYRNGRIITTSVNLLERLDGLDKINGINKVQLKRDKALRDLGI